MCMNYERQLQKMQEENQKFQNLASNLQAELDQEKVKDNNLQVTSFLLTSYDQLQFFLWKPVLHQSK